VRVDVALAVAEGSGAAVGGIPQMRGHRLGAERVLLCRGERGGDAVGLRRPRAR
jgi:hypothetical protein